MSYNLVCVVVVVALLVLVLTIDDDHVAPVNRPLLLVHMASCFSKTVQLVVFEWLR